MFSLYEYRQLNTDRKSFIFAVCRKVMLIREIKFDVTWSYVKRQTAKMKLLPSVFSSLNSRVKIFVFEAISRRHFFYFNVI